MRRGRIAAAGLAGGLLLALGGCDDEPPQAEAIRIYPSVEACRAEHSAAECDAAFSGAQAQHEATAPHYGSMASCEDVYGPFQCVPRSDASGGWFIPAMAGFMIGQALGSTPMAYQPVYVNRAGLAYSGTVPLGAYGPGNSGGVYIWNSTGSPSGVWTSGRYAARPVAARGGFGSSASIAKPLSHSSSFGLGSAADSSSGVTRGGFGSMAHSFGLHGGS